VDGALGGIFIKTLPHVPKLAPMPVQGHSPRPPSVEGDCDLVGAGVLADVLRGPDMERGADP